MLLPGAVWRRICRQASTRAFCSPWRRSPVTLTWLLRRNPSGRTLIRVSLGCFLAANEIVWYAYRLRTEGFRFPETLPLQLCDLTLWLTVLSAFTLNAGVYEVAYFGGLGGSAMALLTPDLWAPFPSYPTAYFFLSHGFVVATLIALAAGRLIVPRPGSPWRVWKVLNLFAGGVAIFDFVFKTNYMYLCVKPASGSLLDYFGPWPVYILSGELFALGIFWLLWLPFGIRADRRRSRA